MISIMHETFTDAVIAGRHVAGIGLGTAPLAFGDTTPEDGAAVVRAALDAGVRLIDTALAYTRAGIESYAEHVVAYALRDVTGERPLVATKAVTGATATASPLTAARPPSARTATSACERSAQTRSTFTSCTTLTRRCH